MIKLLKNEATLKRANMTLQLKVIILMLCIGLILSITGYTEVEPSMPSPDRLKPLAYLSIGLSLLLVAGFAVSLSSIYKESPGTFYVFGEIYFSFCAMEACIFPLIGYVKYAIQKAVYVELSKNTTIGKPDMDHLDAVQLKTGDYGMYIYNEWNKLPAIRALLHFGCVKDIGAFVALYDDNYEEECLVEAVKYFEDNPQVITTLAVATIISPLVGAAYIYWRLADYKRKTKQIEVVDNAVTA